MIRYQKWDIAEGTSFKGYLNLNYDEIVSIFEQPYKSKVGGNKMDWEWNFKLDELIFAIYNYKDGPNYMGDTKIKPENIKKWNVGAKYFSYLKILESYIIQESDKFIGRELIKRKI